MWRRRLGPRYLGTRRALRSPANIGTASASRGQQFGWTRNPQRPGVPIAVGRCRRRFIPSMCASVLTTSGIRRIVVSERRPKLAVGRAMAAMGRPSVSRALGLLNGDKSFEAAFFPFASIDRAFEHRRIDRNSAWREILLLAPCDRRVGYGCRRHDVHLSDAPGGSTARAGQLSKMRYDARTGYAHR